MATKDSRFAQIYRQELAKNKGFMGAFASARSERARENSDLRRLLPKSGVSGAIAERIFGKSYRYGAGRGGIRSAGPASTITEKVGSEKLTRIDINTKITAKNSMVLPAMARDMNLMRLNMQKMVTLSGGKAAVKSDMFFKRTGERESLYESKFKKEGSLLGGVGDAVGGAASAAGGILGGLAKLLGGIGGGLFSIGSSIVGGLVGILGSTAGAIFKVIGGGLAALGPIGVVLSGLAAYLIYKASTEIDFGEIGKSIKKFFGVGDDETEQKSFVRMIAEKLDDQFGTTKFTETLDKGAKLYEDTMNFFSDKIKAVGAKLMEGANLLKDLLIAFGQDVRAELLNFFDKYKPEIYAAMAMGAASLGGPKAMAAAGAAAYGSTLLSQRLGADRQTQLNTLKSGLSSLESELATAPETVPQMGLLGSRPYNPATRGPVRSRAEVQELIDQKKKQLTEVEREISQRTPGNVNRVISEYNQRHASVAPTSPQRVDEGREGRDRGISPSGNSGAMRLNASQREMADLIYSKFTAAGFTPDQANAAVVNALAESSLNPRAANETSLESSYGLFQMNTRGGLGTGHDPQKLKDPNYNIDLMINAARGNAGNRFRQSKDLETAIRTFTEDLERPANKVEKGIERVALAGKIGLTTGNSPSLAQNPITPPSAPEAESRSIFADIEKLLGAVFAAIGDTNKAVQAAISAPASSAQQTANAPIPSPYDSQLFETLLRHHTELGSSIAS